jgi:hypothetical protein
MTEPITTLTASVIATLAFKSLSRADPENWRRNSRGVP